MITWREHQEQQRERDREYLRALLREYPVVSQAARVAEVNRPQFYKLCKRLGVPAGVAREPKEPSGPEGNAAWQSLED